MLGKGLVISYVDQLNVPTIPFMFEPKYMPYFMERNRTIHVRGIFLVDRAKVHGWLPFQPQRMPANRAPSLGTSESDAYVGIGRVVIDGDKIDVGINGIFGECPFDDGLLGTSAAEERNSNILCANMKDSASPCYSNQGVY
jgi:hypothetical protein